MDHEKDDRDLLIQVVVTLLKVSPLNVGPLNELEAWRFDCILITTANLAFSSQRSPYYFYDNKNKTKPTNLLSINGHLKKIKCALLTLATSSIAVDRIFVNASILTSAIALRQDNIDSGI